MFQLMRQFNRTLECISLLNRHFSRIPGQPTSIRGDMERLMDKHNIPASVIESQVEPLIAMEAHVIDGLEPMDPRVRHIFSSADSLFANLSWALYFAEEEGIRFADLRGPQLLAELRHVLSVALDCPLESMNSVTDAASLTDFLENYAAADSTKWSCILFWNQSAQYQELYRRTLARAEVLFAEVESLAQPLMDQYMSSVEALVESQQEGQAIQNVTFLGQGDVRVYPFFMRCQGFGMIWDHTRPSGSGAVMLVGILYRHIQELKAQFGNNSALIASGAKALGDRRRVEILKALAKQPMCNLELAELLNLSAATVVHHMGQLLRENLVTATRQGNRVDYSLRRENLQILAESIQGLIS